MRDDEIWKSIIGSSLDELRDTKEFEAGGPGIKFWKLTFLPPN